MAKTKGPVMTSLDDESRFGIPLITPILARLWMGGVLPGVRLSDDFKYVVSLHPAEKYNLGPETIRHEYDLIDGNQLPDPALLHQIADDTRTYTLTGKTLSHCQAGLNRTGLIVALTMIKAGWHPISAVTELRRLRHIAVLSNPVFENWTSELGDDT